MAAKKKISKKKTSKKKSKKKAIKKKAAGKKAFGRPTSYSDEILEKSNEYLEKYKELGDMIPSVEGLCAHIERARSTVYNWAEQNDKAEFLDILGKINEKQKRVLINGGLSGAFNSNITKLVLGKHGFHDRVDNTSSDGSMTPKTITRTVIDVKK